MPEDTELDTRLSEGWDWPPGEVCVRGGTGGGSEPALSSMCVYMSSSIVNVFFTWKVKKT